MVEVAKGTKRRWTIAVALSLGMGGGVLTLFRSPVHEAGRESPQPKPRAVTLLGETDRAVNDEAVLLDPTPLFLPTKWNASQREVVSPEIGGRYQGFDTPKFTFAETEISFGLPFPVRVPAGPGEAVASDALLAPLVGFGRPQMPEMTPNPRGAYFEVVRAADGKKVMAQGIPDVPLVKASWQPVEFLVNVDATGLVGPLAVVVRSGLDEVDSFFANQLARTLRIGEKLAPGFYRISVGP